MDLEILNKKIGTYRDNAGRVRQVSDELLLEILDAWEHWTGPASGFYTALGVSAKGIGEGFPGGDFKEIKVEASGGVGGAVPCIGIELGLTDGRVVRFPQVDSLVEFLKKAA
jgi:hypothetical protein